MVNINRRTGAELYIHIPFCIRKCEYCDFLSFAADEETVHRYIRALQKEIAIRADSIGHKKVISVYFGGGTPSSISADYISDIMDTVRFYYDLTDDAEITIEVNPGTVSTDKFKIYHACGINRVSIGLQSTDDDLLARLGRIHTYDEFLECYKMARKCGFTNINVDLMSAIPGQSLTDWGRSLDKVIELKPEHISAYSLIIEEGTPFYDRYGEDNARREHGEDPYLLADEESERMMYYMTIQNLCSAGYENYEISNFAKPGYESRHNTGYWIRREYLGMGLGAASLVMDSRFSNTRDINEYMEMLECGKQRFEDIQHLDRKDKMEEFMFLGLRMTRGISRSDFEEEFEMPIESIYGDALNKLSNAGLIMMVEDRIFLTSEGVDVSNYVLSEFLID